ncbi:MAG TPA: hypothetical protein VJI15_03270 [Candidatus Nanoarchaeia archaeon]|nr:hypothetical protein [Candidatus Nanoarchaeia archaeon]
MTTVITKAEKLPELWEILQRGNQIFPQERYLGLQEVQFTEPIDNFERRYRTEVEQIPGRTAMVTTDVQECIDLITGKNVDHHISCKSPQPNSLNDDTALCMHVYVSETETYTVALPGVNYVYSDETRKKNSWLQKRS